MVERAKLRTCISSMFRLIQRNLNNLICIIVFFKDNSSGFFLRSFKSLNYFPFMSLFRSVVFCYFAAFVRVQACLY